jgi:hypothetical protein
MKTRFTRLALLGFALVPLFNLRAAFDPAIVSADAQWVFHADLNALRSGTIGKELVAEAEKIKLDVGDAKVGLDVQKLLVTVGSITAYGSNFANNPSAIDGTLVIRGTPDLPKIAEATLIQASLAHPENVAELKGLPFSAYTIAGQPASDVANPAAAQTTLALDVIVAFPPGSTVLVSKSKAQLLKANEILRGSAPSLAKNPSSALTPLLHNAGDAYLFAASVVPSDKFFTPDMPQARILQMANAGSISIGESGPLTYAHVELTASNEEMADKLVKILQGMTAMMSLAETSDKQLAEFLNSASVVRKDKSVTLHLAYASDRLVQMVKSVTENRPRNGVRRAEIPPKVVTEWKAGEVTPAANGLATKTLETVHLKSGTTLSVIAKKADFKNPQLDRLEVIPVNAPNAPLVFRAEYMRLTGWSIDGQPATTGGKMVTGRAPTSIARQTFPGVEGDYTIRVVYAGQAPDPTVWSVTTRDPDAAAPAAEAAPVAMPAPKSQE